LKINIIRSLIKINNIIELNMEFFEEL